jgi:orotate phosphoribosyltransferase
MTEAEVLAEFRAAGALLEGHFILSSGRHSSIFFQKNFIFMDPARTEKVCRALAAKAREAFGRIDVVVSPAVGAIIPGYETARHLGARALFVEREGGQFALRRGFAIAPGERVLIGVPLLALARVDAPSYAPDQLPPELAALPAVKPGSRHLSS